ncbi:HPt (histidine-containing phosphotransfer) domain-containing protein [Wenyingzhuangia heitensis]|uniref:HPt (Histidine-containing phosphotransfer) domain-containing protein n=1 Tax=Wenyingzhuangia heitensis TaxID=1487859 RepID=A0ABX0U6H7_9FLAO|nr:Hpt domain-containing protein [Wenyingzhuangia heitensis]NIJ44467.1 HPt (histidine-containing phosphotransfer) domain-containing protein [Wenyingzhuangia heitensis]
METPNLNYIKELSGGDVTFEKQIIDIVKEEFPTEKEVYFNSVNADDFEAMIEIVHKLKHKISIFGLTKAYEVAVHYEKNLKEGTKKLKEEFEEILKLITSYLETI